MRPWRIASILACATLLFAAENAPLPAHGGRLFYLSIGGPGGGRVLSANDDGTDLKVVLGGRNAGPDGIVVDTASKKIYWTNMGKVSANDGTIERSDLDGGNLTTIVPLAGTWTPKQLKLDVKNGKLYWSDREGMRIMRANLDGSNIETLVETAQGDAARKDATNWCVGIALDVAGGKVYWTQKAAAVMDASSALTWKSRKGRTRCTQRYRSAFRRAARTDRYGPRSRPSCNVLDGSRRSAARQHGEPRAHGSAEEIRSEGAQGSGDSGGWLEEGIGIALDLKGGRMYYTDLGGNVYSARLDGSDSKTLLTGQGSLTGITWVDLGK